MLPLLWRRRDSNSHPEANASRSPIDLRPHVQQIARCCAAFSMSSRSSIIANGYYAVPRAGLAPARLLVRGRVGRSRERTPSTANAQSRAYGHATTRLRRRTVCENPVKRT